MTGVSFQLETNGLAAALTRLNHLAALDKHELMEGLGRRGQEQTRHRIEVEKTTPGGAAWKPTSDGRGALFVTGAHLARSIDYTSGETEARWGSGFNGARILHFGGVIAPVNARVLAFSVGGKKVFAKKVTIPSRKFVGLSAANEQEMVDTAETFIGKALQ
jgi:phage gpG-like protein